MSDRLAPEGHPFRAHEAGPGGQLTSSRRGGAVAIARAAAGPSRTRVAFPAEHGALAGIRARLAGTLRDQGWEEEEIGRVLLAVQEALGNAVEHGSLPGAPLTLGLSVGGARASVIVRDWGRPGAAAPLGAPSAPSGGAPRGRGRLIMEVLAERYLTIPRGAGTEVWLEFRRASRNVQPAA